VANSIKPTKKGKSTVPAKPYEGFPLFAHQTGRWAKKVRGKIRFYGRWGKVSAGKLVPVDDVEASASKAKIEFDRCWPYHSEGREAPGADDGEYLTLRELASRFLDSKHARLETGELSRHSMDDYFRVCQNLINHFGPDKRVDDFRPADFEALRAAMAKDCGLVALKNKVNRARIVLKFAYDSRLIDRPIEFGKSFDRPSAMRLRESRNRRGENLLSREELLVILDALSGKTVTVGADPKQITLAKSPAMLAMVLLGLNAGFGNTDVATLPKSAVDLKNGWIEFPRPKTAIKRRVPLWPETLEALRTAIDSRPRADDSIDDGLCLLTDTGKRFVRVQTSKNDDRRYVVINTIGRKFEALLNKLQIGQSVGIGFYTLRHVFETAASGSKDQIAVDAIMGHVDSSMAAVYREKIDDDRLRAVTDQVRVWLWPDVVATESKPKKAKKSTAKKI
jgi:integrase